MRPRPVRRLTAALLPAVALAAAPVHDAARAASPPCRCLTPHAMRAHQGHVEAPPGFGVGRDDWLDPVPRGGSPSTHISPLGLFSLQYVTTGEDSVPDVDTDPANGIPDFVERCAEYADRSWTVEVDSLQFAPPVLPPDGTYDITFVGLPSGNYGYTTVSGTTTEIVLHRSFTGGIIWPGPTDDPDGDQLGRAKVTIAHEFKHASQFATSGWTEGLWNEADAMWVEDIVYPFVNEYRYWLDAFSQSQLDEPWLRIDNDAGQGNYEDCLWHHWISGQWGAAGVHDYWTRRAQHPAEPVLDSYAAMLAARGTSWVQAYAGHLEWCWFTESRAQPGFGFPDAAALFKMRVYEPTIMSFPHVATASVDRLAGHPRRCHPAAGVGRPRIVFDGEDDATGLVVSLITCLTDSSFTIQRLALGPGNTANVRSEETWAELAYLGILVTNGDPADTARTYELQIIDDVSTPAPERTRSPLRLTAAPNPAGGEVSFALPAATAPGRRLRILDVTGREVRAIPAPGTGARWDGRDGAGHAVPSGVYWAIVDDAGRRLATRVVRVR